MAKLTKRVVDQAAAGDKATALWDDELKGFGLRIQPSGRKVYVVKCRINGRQKFITIGTHGPFTAEKARVRAIEILSEAKGGRNPARALDQLRKSPTMKELGERFLKEHVAHHCKPTTQAEYKRSVELFINPRIGRQKLVAITNADVAELHAALAHIPYQANRTLGVLSKMMNLAETWGYRDRRTNPCDDVQKFPERKRTRYLSRDELHRLGTALADAEADGSESAYAVAAIRLLLLTGCRLKEIQTLKWEHVFLDDAELRLPDSKSGPKTIYLGGPAVGILRTVRQVEDNPYVIVGFKQGHYLADLQHPWQEIRKRADLGDVHIHDLRHSFASVAVAKGENLPMIGKLLGHTQVQTTARYAHLASDPVKKAADRVSADLASAMQPRAANDNRRSEDVKASIEE